MQPLKRWWTGIVRTIRPRSNGLYVRRNTAAHIASADKARGRQDWAVAASFYRRALAGEPQLHHIWVQLGHMEKEAGKIDEAGTAYKEAARLRPDDAEPLLHMGHMAKAWWQPVQAAACFVAALERDGNNLQALSELARLMPDRDHVDAKLWASALAVLNIDPAAQANHEMGDLPPQAILFDVTDLFAFFGQRRLPTGIQRVQIEVSLALLDNNGGRASIFCLYSSGRRGWIRLPHNDFRALCMLARLSDDSDDPVWTSQLSRIYRTAAVSRTILFSPATTLINLGTSWADRNYLLDVRTIRARDGILYVPLVFDLIPLIRSDWFMQSLVRDYRAWFESLLHSADGCIAISQATRRDLIDASVQWGTPMPAGAVPVVRLDGDFRQGTVDPSLLQTYGLSPQGYVLLVSTLEPRKNHIGAFRAWLTLAQQIGEDAMPRLVCVGGRGWLNDDLHQMLRDHPPLQRMVDILHGVPDDALASLYEYCLFALYPSFYEGWGLPVSEALSYGKVAAISDVSSLPEAGGKFARYFDPNDAGDIAATVHTLLDDKTRLCAEAVIEQAYIARSWRQIACDLVAKAQEVPPRVETLPRIAGAGQWSLSRRGDDDSSAGEPLRHGHGWLAPMAAGCGICGGDAALWFHWTGSPGFQVHVYIAAMPAPSAVQADLDGLPREGRTTAHASMVLSWPLPDVSGPVRITLTPSASGVIAERLVIASAA